MRALALQIAGLKGSFHGLVVRFAGNWPRKCLKGDGILENSAHAGKREPGQLRGNLSTLIEQAGQGATCMWISPGSGFLLWMGALEMLIRYVNQSISDWKSCVEVNHC
jgi:hypothetical protein